MKQIVLICVFIAVGFGASVPTKSSFDSKIAYAVFNAQDVLTITAANGYVSVIEFAPNERVINIAAGLVRVGRLWIEKIYSLSSQKQ